MIGHRFACLAVAGAAIWSVAAEAQPYPVRSITIVVPYAAGGVFDTIARIIGERMGEVLGQSMIVENVTGAGGIIGVQRAINARIGVEVAHIPYRGGGPAANDLIGGRIDYMCGNIGTVATRVAAMQSKPIALLSRERTPLMPELATVHEQGITDYDVVTWTAFFLPKGAPKDVVARLNEATHVAMDTPAVKARFNDIGVVGVAPERRGPEYLARFVVEEIARWEGPIKAAGLQVD
jgi:tripartite-type tricarboxylate transporter receptor subunit TctC